MIKNYVDLTNKTLLVPIGLYENLTMQRIKAITNNYDSSLFDVRVIKNDNYYIIKISSKIVIEEV